MRTKWLALEILEDQVPGNAGTPPNLQVDVSMVLRLITPKKKEMSASAPAV
jgi:hypothetical protein